LGSQVKAEGNPKGGQLPTEEIDAGSMMSKKQEGLLFFGGNVDVTGDWWI